MVGSILPDDVRCNIQFTLSSLQTTARARCNIQFTLSSLQTTARKRGGNCDAACDVTCPSAHVDSVHHTELVASPIGDRQPVQSPHGVGDVNARAGRNALQRSPARKRCAHASRHPSEYGVAEINAREIECRRESLSRRLIEHSLELAQMTEVKKSKSITNFPTCWRIQENSSLEGPRRKARSSTLLRNSDKT